MFGLFKKAKFKLKEGMDIEVEVVSPEGARSYFTKVVQASKKKAIIQTPKMGKRSITFAPEQIVRCVAYIDKLLYEVNLQVMTCTDKEFEAVISKNLQFYETFMTKLKKKQDIKIDTEIPLDFRAITTSHFQRATTKDVNSEYCEMITNLPVPEGTDLKLIFKVPECPPIETEGKSEKSFPLEEENGKQSQTHIVFTDKAKESDMIGKLAEYTAFYMRREERRKEMEEKGEIPKRGEAIKPPAPRGPSMRR